MNEERLRAGGAGTERLDGADMGGVRSKDRIVAAVGT